MNVQDLNVELNIFDNNQKFVQKLEIIVPFDQEIKFIDDYIINYFSMNSILVSGISYFYNDKKLEHGKKIYNYFQFFQDQYLLTSAIPINAFLDVSLQSDSSSAQIESSQNIIELIVKKKFDLTFELLDEFTKLQLQHFWYGTNFFEDSEIFLNQENIQEINNALIQTCEEDDYMSVIENYNKDDISKYALLINYSIFLLQQKNYIIALENLKNCSKVLFKIEDKRNERQFLLSKCYLLISICLVKTNKLEEASNIIQKAMKFLFDNHIYDMFFLNNYISLLFQIDQSNQKIHQTLAKYLKHCEKLLQEKDEVVFAHQNIIFITNLISILKKLEIENPFQNFLERSKAYLQNQFRKLYVLKFFFPRKFRQISEDLLQIILMQLQEEIDDQPEYLILQAEDIIEKQDFLTERISSYQIDLMNIKACIAIQFDYDNAMNCLTNSIEFSKNFDSNHPVHEKLLKNLNIFNNIKNQLILYILFLQFIFIKYQKLILIQNTFALKLVLFNGNKIEFFQLNKLLKIIPNLVKSQIFSSCYNDTIHEDLVQKYIYQKNISQIHELIFFQIYL